MCDDRTLVKQPVDFASELKEVVDEEEVKLEIYGVGPLPV